MSFPEVKKKSNKKIISKGILYIREVIVMPSEDLTLIPNKRLKKNWKHILPETIVILFFDKTTFANNFSI